VTDKPASLAEALVAFQAELPEIRKDRTADTGSYSYTYADLATVSTMVLPYLALQGLSWTTRPTLLTDGKLVLAYKLMHVSGESIEGEYPLPQGTPQQVGSAITYARRYALCAVTGVAPEQEDDDGAKASQAPVQQPAPRRIEPTKDMIRKMVDGIYEASDRDALRGVWAAIAASGMQETETIDHEGNPITLRDLAIQRGSELPEKQETADAGA
jgi:ERF superfamily